MVINFEMKLCTPSVDHYTYGMDAAYKIIEQVHGGQVAVFHENIISDVFSVPMQDIDGTIIDIKIVGDSLVFDVCVLSAKMLDATQQAVENDTSIRMSLVVACDEDVDRLVDADTMQFLGIEWASD
jgi:hypothetical protein